MSSSRRRFLSLGAAAPVASFASAPAAPLPAVTDTRSLNGEWLFRLDAQNAGESQAWHKPAPSAEGWRTVTVPHTWQIEEENTGYMGVGWYRRTFEAPKTWSDSVVRVEFEAVFHTAIVWLNGFEVGRHVGKGYTAFTLDLTPHLRLGEGNTLVVRADNAFNESMLPRGKSSDWTHDGGIYRPVQLLVSPAVYVQSLAIDSEPVPGTPRALLEIAAVVHNASPEPWSGSIGYSVVDEQSGLTALAKPVAANVHLAAGEKRRILLPAATLEQARLWHFDHPNLYRLDLALSSGHTIPTIFGIRKIETRDSKFYLNGEMVRLMGVERMAGSNPEFGMVEPMEWLDHDHADMKELNCVYTRVHWQQDRRLLDWCDRHGVFIQTEVPTWGGNTFKGMTDQPADDIMNNGLEQLREMIERDRNHPCLFSWGVCNEIPGQRPAGYAFAKRMYDEAKRLDPRRLVSYASNTLSTTPEKDVAGLMDYVMWNEYYESWNKGTPGDMARALDEIHRVFPGKPIVISEYGYCACTTDRPEGDSKRVNVLRAHDALFRERDFMGGLIFFCYNDYRTHIGDKGTGVMKQRVHGVVDVYGAKKPSWEALRDESSPIEWLRVAGKPEAIRVSLKTRTVVPCYTLEGYQLRAVAYGFGNIPLERRGAKLRTLKPGESEEVALKFMEKGIHRIEVEVLRPTGYSTLTAVWQY
ncbi:MAG: beta galactosidase jelly roll domain-containing protein [Acidobacteria bacterium]|nr:beta galactosidase jelly roll domain-containing protein [Acidobacteriota bacterium]